MDDKTIHEEETIREGIPTEGNSERVPFKNFKDYLIVETLPAIGGEADAFVVKKDGELFFLKLYRTGIEPKEEVLRKTYEISLQAQEHVVRIYEYGYESTWKRWYEIQEYVKLGNLMVYVKDHNLFGKENFISDVIGELSESINFLHQLDIIHRDLKPTNILVRRDKPLNLILSDFGISSLIDSDVSKILTTVKGTYTYSAPESFSGYFGKEVDWWAFGMIILELFTGKNPFHGLSQQVIMNTLFTKFVPIPDNIPQKYKKLLMGLLTRDPKKRWGYEQVKGWLEGKEDIPVYYEQDSKEYSIDKWLEAGFTVQGANVWKKITNDPILARVLKNDAGLTYKEAKKWLESGLRNPHMIVDWKNAGFEDPEDVKLYEDLGLGPKQSINLEKLGYTAKLVFFAMKKLHLEYEDLIKIGRNAQKRKLDLNLCFSFFEVTGYNEEIFEHIIYLRDENITPNQIKEILGKGLSVKEFINWRKKNFEVDEAIKWKKYNFDDKEASEWKKAGFYNVEEANIWKKEKFTPKEALKWKNAEFNAFSAKKWMINSFNIEEAHIWKSAGFEPEEAKEWKTARLDIYQAKKIKYLELKLLKIIIKMMKFYTSTIRKNLFVLLFLFFLVIIMVLISLVKIMNTMK